MSFNRSPFKSVQNFAFNFTSASGNVALGTTIDSRYSMVVFGGNNSFDVTGFPCGTGGGIFYALDNAHLYYTSFTPPGNLYASVIEFYSYQLRQPTQYFTGFMNGVSFVDVTIAAIGPKAFICYLGSTENKVSVQTDMASLTASTVFLNSTTVRCGRAGTGGANAPDQMTVGFCVVDPF